LVKGVDGERWHKMAVGKPKGATVKQESFLDIVPTQKVDIGGFVPRHKHTATKTTEAERRAMHNFKPLIRHVGLTPDEKVDLIDSVSK